MGRLGPFIFGQWGCTRFSVTRSIKGLSRIDKWLKADLRLDPDTKAIGDN